MEIDKLDNKIISELLQNGRISMNILSKKTHCSREMITYRLNRLVKSGIIKNFIADINIENLGFVGAAVFIATKMHRDKEFRDFLMNDENICWVGEQIGIWTYGFSLYAGSVAELDRKFLQIYTEFKDTIIDYRLTLHKKNTFLYDKFFQSSLRETTLITKNSKIDDIDKRLLSLISMDARISATELSEKLKLTPTAVIYRLRNIERSGIIKKYSVFVDFTKLGLYQYSIFIENKNLDKKSEILTYLKNNKNVCFICEYSGEPFLEFGILIKDPYNIKSIFQELAQRFPDFRILEFSLQKEIASISPPKCIFK